MLTVDGKFFGSGDDYYSTRFFELVHDTFWVYRFWINGNMSNYKYQYSVECQNGCSFWFGLGYNSPDGYVGNKWRIEFNPNKVFKEYYFLRVYTAFLFLTRPDTLSIRRFDLAIDYPVARSCCCLRKDQRTYCEYTNSLEDRTQNLGTHSNHGYVKLYNKALESNIPTSLTRLELTVDYLRRSFDDILEIFPKVYVIENVQMKFDELKLSDTDKFLMFSCLENPYSLNMLSRYKRKKIESLIPEYSRLLKIDKKDYNYILNLLPEFVNYSFVSSFMNSDDVVTARQFYSGSDDYIHLTADEVAELNLLFDKS